MVYILCHYQTGEGQGSIATLLGEDSEPIYISTSCANWSFSNALPFHILCLLCHNITQVCQHTVNYCFHAYIFLVNVP